MPQWQMKLEPQERHMVSRTPLQESMNQNAQCQISEEYSRMEEAVKRNNNAGKRRARRKGKGKLVEKMKDMSNNSEVSSACSASSSSERSIVFPRRPGYGQLGTKCLVKANHFIAELSERNLSQYSVRRC